MDLQSSSPNLNDIDDLVEAVPRLISNHTKFGHLIASPVHEDVKEICSMPYYNEWLEIVQTENRDETYREVRRRLPQFYQSNRHRRIISIERPYPNYSIADYNGNDNIEDDDLDWRNNCIRFTPTVTTAVPDIVRPTPTNQQASRAGHALAQHGESLHTDTGESTITTTSITPSSQATCRPIDLSLDKCNTKHPSTDENKGEPGINPPASYREMQLINTRQITDPTSSQPINRPADKKDLK